MKSKLYNAYIGELFKTSRKGTFVKLLIALIVVFILVSILFTVISNLYEEVGIQDEIGLIEFQTNDEAIEYYEQLIKDQETYKETVNMIGINDNTLYSYKANLAKYKYLKEHNISPTSVNDFSGQSLSMNANTFVPTIMSIVVTILIIFSIIFIILILLFFSSLTKFKRALSVIFPPVTISFSLLYILALLYTVDNFTKL